MKVLFLPALVAVLNLNLNSGSSYSTAGNEKGKGEEAAGGKVAPGLDTALLSPTSVSPTPPSAVAGAHTAACGASSLEAPVAGLHTAWLGGCKRENRGDVKKVEARAKKAAAAAAAEALLNQDGGSGVEGSNTALGTHGGTAEGAASGSGGGAAGMGQQLAQIQGDGFGRASQPRQA